MNIDGMNSQPKCLMGYYIYEKLSIYGNSTTKGMSVVNKFKVLCKSFIVSEVVRIQIYFELYEAQDVHCDP